MKKLIALAGALGVLAVVAASSALSATTGGAIRVYAVNSNPNSKTNGGTVLITGAIGAKGNVQNINKNLVKLVFRQGTFEIDATKLNNTKTASSSLSKTTCSGYYAATVPLPLLDGTGAYTGISGSVKLTFTEAFVLPRKANGKCNQNANGTDISYVVGSGSVSF